MQANDKPAEKRTAVDYLNFGAKTARRVSWETFEFTVVGPYQVRVTNLSYGYLADDHSYVVGVNDQDGVIVPSECECKADLYNENYDCKHKVALAIVGGKTVLEAATQFSSKPNDSETNTETVTAADKLRADGGTDNGEAEAEPCPSGDPDCCGPDGDDLPCFDCYRLIDAEGV